VICFPENGIQKLIFSQCLCDHLSGEEVTSGKQKTKPIVRFKEK